MSRIVDDITLDPIEVSPGRTELNLSEMGLSVIGADFGEAAIEGTSVRQQFGEVMVDRRPKTKTIVLRLRVREDAEADLATAAYRLQQKVGTLHREGGWMRRDFHVGEFAGSLLCKIVGEVTLADFAGWQAGDSPDVTLTLVAGPIWYSTEVDESPLFVEESARALVYELPETKGTAEGLKRIAITNKNAGGGDWRGLIWAEESRDYSEGNTANPVFEADALTPKGGASVKTLSGASGSKAVEHPTLTAGWLTILDSEIQAVGHMTHLGPRRMKMRIHSPEGQAAGAVELRLLWRSLGASRWSEDNPVVATPLANGFAIVDLGECRPQQAALGEQRWEWKLLARAPGGSGKVSIDQVYVLPTEQLVVLSEPSAGPPADSQSVKPPGTVESDAAGGTLTWSNPANAKGTSNAYATAVNPNDTIESSRYLKATNFGFGLLEAAQVLGIGVGIERKAADNRNGKEYVSDAEVRILKGGTPVGTNKALTSLMWPTSDAYVFYGGSGDLWGETWSFSDVNAPNFGVAFRATVRKTTAYVDQIEITVYYTEAPDEDRICFASRGIELRFDGTYRETAEGGVWGRVVEDGSPPVAVPSALEGRPSRGLILPSRGDLIAQPDADNNLLNARIQIRAGYHFAREAAE